MGCAVNHPHPSLTRRGVSPSSLLHCERGPTRIPLLTEEGQGVASSSGFLFRADFPQTRRLAAQLAKVIELGAAHPAGTDHFDLADGG